MTRPERDTPDPRFAFECPRAWESLDPTADAAVRHCGTCDRPVHLSRDAREAEANGRAGRCVALAVPVRPRRPSVLRRIWNGLAASLRVLVHGRSPLPLHAIPDPPPPPPPPPSMKMGMFVIEREEPPVIGWLVRIEGPRRGQLIQLGMTTATIGSSPTATVVLDDLEGCDVRCRVAGSPAGFVLFDDGGTTGVVANGRRVGQIDLVDGDRIDLGPARYVFKDTR